jgi:hypothetical protein
MAAREAERSVLSNLRPVIGLMLQGALGAMAETTGLLWGTGEAGVRNKDC